MVDRVDQVRGRFLVNELGIPGARPRVKHLEAREPVPILRLANVGEAFAVGGAQLPTRSMMNTGKRRDTVNLDAVRVNEFGANGDVRRDRDRRSEVKAQV